MCQDCDRARKDPSIGVDTVARILSQMMLHPVMRILVVRIEEIYGEEMAKEIVVSAFRSIADKLEKEFHKPIPSRDRTQADTSMVDTALDGIVDAVFMEKKGRKKRGKPEAE